MGKQAQRARRRAEARAHVREACVEHGGQGCPECGCETEQLSPEEGARRLGSDFMERGYSTLGPGSEVVMIWVCPCCHASGGMIWSEE